MVKNKYKWAFIFKQTHLPRFPLPPCFWKVQPSLVIGENDPKSQEKWPRLCLQWCLLNFQERKKKKAHSWAPGQQLALVQRAQELVRARGLLDMGGHIHFPLPPSSNRMFNHHHHFQLWLLASSVLGVAISCTKSICRKWWFTSPLLKKKKKSAQHDKHQITLCTNCTTHPSVRALQEENTGLYRHTIV